MPAQDEVFPDREHFGRILIIRRMSAPQACRRSRSSWDLHTPAALCAGRCRMRAIIGQGPGHDLYRRPHRWLKAPTGRNVTAEELGRGPMWHSRSSGAPTITRSTIARARIARPIVAIEFGEEGYRLRMTEAARATLSGRGDINGIIPHDVGAYEVRDIIAQYRRCSEWDEFKKL